MRITQFPWFRDHTTVWPRWPKFEGEAHIAAAAHAVNPKVALEKGFVLLLFAVAIVSAFQVITETGADLPMLLQ